MARRSANPDTLILNYGDGSDVVDFERLDADSTQSGNQNFIFIGANAFGNTPGQLRAFQVGGNNWQAEADVNGDGIADLCILFDTPVPLTVVTFTGLE